MKDFKGQELNVGDKVVFCIGPHLRESKVIEIINNGYHDLALLERIKKPFYSSKVYKI